MAFKNAFRIFLFVVFIFSLVQSLKDELKEPLSKVDCVNELIDICKHEDYSSIGDGFIKSDFTDYDTDPEKPREILCTTFRDGTDCIINGSKWLYCSSDNGLFYKGKPLKENSTENTDDEICYPIKLKIEIQRKVEQFVLKVDNKLNKLDAKLREKLGNLGKGLSSFESGLKSGLSSLKSQVKEGLNEERGNLDNGLSHLHSNLDKLGDTLSKPCFPFCY